MYLNNIFILRIKKIFIVIFKVSTRNIIFDGIFELFLVLGPLRRHLGAPRPMHQESSLISTDALSLKTANFITQICLALKGSTCNGMVATSEEAGRFVSNT